MRIEIDARIEPIARAAAKLGGRLQCAKCGYRLALGGKPKVEQYLREGWPMHCRQTMEWLTDKQLRASPPTQEGKESR